jgi:hypothetical protein
MSTFTIPDPLAGDPDTLARFAAKYHSISEALKSAAAELATLANTDMTISLAIDEVRSKASAAQADTLNVALHYGGASTTYATYASKLKDAQSRADHARATIAGFKGSADHAKQARDSVVDQTAFMLPNQQTADDLQAANAEFARYQNDYHSAMAIYNQAVSDKATAVRDAIAQLEDAAKAAGLTDSNFEAFKAQLRDAYEWAKKYLAPLLEKIRAVLKVVKDIVDLIAVVASVLKIPQFAFVVAMVDLAVSELVFNCTAVLFFLGAASAGDVISAGLDMAVSVLAVIPAGQAAGVFIKSAVKEAFQSKVLTSVGNDLVNDGPGFAKDVLGTDSDALGGGNYTLPDPFVDVTSAPWGAQADPPSSETPQQFGGSLLFDGVKAIPVVGSAIGDISSLVTDIGDLKQVFSGTGS